MTASSDALPETSLVARIHLWIRKHQWQSFALVACCWGATALAATRMQADTSSLAFFPDEAPEIRQMAEALDISPASRLLFVDLSTPQPGKTAALAQAADAIVQALPPALAERAGTFTMPDPGRLLALLPFFTDAKALELLLAATDEAQVDASVRSARDSLGSLLSSAVLPWLQSDPLAFRRVLLSRLPASETEALPDPLLGYPVSRDEQHLLLMLRPKHSLHDVQAATRLMDSLQAALRAHLQPGMQSLVVGGHRHSAANNQAIKQDIANIAMFSLAGFALIYLLLVRSKGALWILLVPCCAISVGLGGMVLLVPVLSGLALGFGASVLGIADHYAVYMHFALRSGRHPVEVLETMTGPIFRAYVINAAGFAVLLLSGIPAVRQLAGFALLILGAGFVLAVTIAPVCPWFAEPVTRSSRRLAAPRQPVAWRAAVCAAALAALGCAFFTAVRFDASPRTLGADMEQLQQDALRLRAVWGSQDRDMLVVGAQDVETALELTRGLVARLRQQAPANAVSTVTDIWPSPEQSRENVARWTAFVSEHGEELKTRLRGAARRYGFTGEAFAPFERLLAAPDGPFAPELLRAAGLGELLALFMHETGAGPVKILLFTQQQADISGLPPELRSHVLALSPGSLETALLQQLDREKYLVPLAWLACFSLLCLYFRDVRRTLLASLPPLCSSSCILAWMACTGTPMTLAGMAALPLVLGLAADHGVMVTHNLAHGMDMGLGRAILVGALLTMTGIGLLALAHHPALKAMGEVIFWGLLIEVPAALWLLPRLCQADAASPGKAT